jgi:hypothetical protein
MHSNLNTLLIPTTRGTREYPTARWRRGVRGRDQRWAPR